MCCSGVWSEKRSERDARTWHDRCDAYRFWYIEVLAQIRTPRGGIGTINFCHRHVKRPEGPDPPLTISIRFLDNLIPNRYNKSHNASLNIAAIHANSSS